MTRSPRVVRVATETGQSPMTGPWKILMVIETSGGGSGRHVLDLAGSFSDRGHEVHILYSPRRAEPRFVSELENIDAVKTTAVDLRRSPHYSDIRALRVIGGYLVQQGPFDVVHGHSSKGALACIAARRLRIASIFTPHAPRSLDPTIPRPLRRVFRLFDSLLVSSADAIIAVSDEEYAFLRAKGLPAERLFKVINGLAPQSVVDRTPARGVQAPGEDPMRAAQRGNGGHAVLGLDGLGADHPAPRRWLANTRPGAAQAAD